MERDIAGEQDQSPTLFGERLPFLYIGAPLGVLASLVMFYIESRQASWLRASSALMFPVFAPLLLYWMHRDRSTYEHGLRGMALLIVLSLISGALLNFSSPILLIWIPVIPLSYVLLLGHARAVRWNVATLLGLIVAYILFPVMNDGARPVSVLIFGVSLLAASVSMLLSWHHYRELSVYQRRLYEQASYDGLTGAMMREPGMEILARFMSQADRQPAQAVSVALLDLDDFKRINDEEGHLAGDRVLQGVTAEVRAHIRGGDYLIRLGGEEFLIIFPGMQAEEAYALSETLRQRIPAVTDGLSRRPVTTSIGLAQYRPGEALGQLLGRADHLMYAAKTTGKNKVCTDMASSGQPTGATESAG
ncbi:GGDEF domain-containing protein [Acidihalobacter yilgarnensis]|uniref:GGDEF domain-containing protein n=1 Tax=Acidihalobacter yilgarnensis TaxID=2819280 RepID=UPI0018D275E7|nr:GGDEF domain-containing protein [Acidihalobacter yilgarnensis]